MLIKKVFRKILSNFYVKFLFLLIFVMTVFSFGSGHFDFVKAYSDTVKVIPGSFYFDEDEFVMWQAVDNIFYQDLSAQANFDDFNPVNSAYFSLEEIEYLKPSLEIKNDIWTPRVELDALDTGQEQNKASEIIIDLNTSDGSVETVSGNDEVNQVLENELNDVDLESTETKNNQEEIFQKVEADLREDESSGQETENQSSEYNESQESGQSVEDNSSWEDSVNESLDNNSDNQSSEDLESSADVGFNESDEDSKKEVSWLNKINHFFNISKYFAGKTVFATGSENMIEEDLDSGSKSKEKNVYFNNFSVPLSEDKPEDYSLKLFISMAAKGASGGEVIDISFRDNSEEVIDWRVLDSFYLDEIISNYENNDYFILDIPESVSWEQIDNLEIKLSVRDENGFDIGKLPIIFLDSLWLEVNYGSREPTDDYEEIQEKVVTEKKGEDFVLDLISAKTEFKTSEKPEFNFKFKKNKKLVKKIIDGIVNLFSDEYKDIAVAVDVQGLNIDEEESPKFDYRYVGDGEFEIFLLKDPRRFKPGKYTMYISISDNGEIYESSQDFNWGVLGMNFNKSVYKKGESAYIQMAVLDENGDTVCDPEYLLLEVRQPDGTYKYLSTFNTDIIINSLCGPNNVINEPDFYAYFKFKEEGYYDFKLTAQGENGEFKINETIEVKKDIQMEIERIGPTRVYPKALYKMNFVVTSDEDYQGVFVEKVPKGFEFADKNKYQIEEKENYYELIWEVDWQAGKTYEFFYTFDAPDISPEFYLLGPAETEKFTEARYWQIANDAPVGENPHAFVSYDTIITTSVGTAGAWTEISNYTIDSSNFTAGDQYLVMVNFSLNSDSTSESAMAQVRHGSTVFSDSGFRWETRRSGSAYTGHGYQWFTVWTAVDGESVYVDISDSGTGNVYSEGYQAFVLNLDEYLVESTDWYYDTATHSGNLSSAWSTDGASIDISGGNNEWMVMAMGQFLSDSTSADMQMRINNTTDSNIFSSLTYEGEDVDDYRPLVAMTGDIISGTETWRVDAADAAATQDWTDSKIFALNINAFRDHQIATGTGLVAIAPQSTWVQAHSMASYNVESTADTFVWSNEVVNMGENRKVLYTRVQVDNTTTPTGFDDFARELPAGSTDYNAIHNFFVSSMSTGSHTIDADLQETVDAVPNPIAQDHNMVAFSLELKPITVLNVLGQEQYEADATTTIANGGWTDDEVVLYAQASDLDGGSSYVDLYFELIASSSSFTTSTSTPSGACSSGTTYSSCASNIWTVQASASGSIATGTVSITSIPEELSGYKWQVFAIEEVGNSSSWGVYNESVPNFYVDTASPTPPGALTENSTLGTSIALNFGASTTETFFSHYKIFYKEGSSGVTESDTEHLDSNLNYQDYNSAQTTTINGLSPGLTYVFNIWAYDLSGKKASSTEISLTTATALSVTAYKQYKSNGLTEIANNAYTNESEVVLSALASDVNATTTEVDFYFQVAKDDGSFIADTNPPGSSCVSGTAFGSCSSKIWTVFASSSAWYDDNWIYRKKLTINSTYVESTELGFPVLATTTDPNLAHISNGGNVASSTGADIVVTDSDAQTLLNFEREYYDPSTGELVIWVKTDISSTTNKDIYIYYGNSSVNQDYSTTTGVWDSNYVMVQHLEESSGVHYDSTFNSNDSATVSVTNQDASGQIDGADEFGGAAAGNQIDLNTSASFNALDNMTAEAWINTDNNAVANQSIISFYSRGNDRTWMYLADNTNGIRIYNDLNNSNADFATTGIAPDSSTWHHVAWVIDGAYWRIFIDGEEQGLSASALTMSSLDDGFSVSIGRRAGDEDYEWDGKLDEIRVSNTARSSNWLRTQYNNQKDVNTFISIGSQETEPNANGIVNITSLPDRGTSTDSDVGYKWQVMSCNASNACSSWDDFNPSIPNFKIDTTAPNAPGDLSLATTTPTSIELNFGSEASDNNFSHYKIFYKKGILGVSPADTEHSDSNLSYIDYNGAATTTITGLEAYTQYVINIYAYDGAGNYTSATELSVTTSQAPHARARSVMFLGGTYSANGNSGKLSDTNHTFSSFNFNLAETEVEIRNAYVLFESQFEAYHSNASNYTGFNLAFDVCQESCTADAFSGTGNVLLDDNTTLVYGESGSNQVRLLMDVTDEVQLATYVGDATNMEAQIGYRLETGSATSSIASAKAKLIITYAFNNDDSDNYTNTVIYPLESSNSGDSGSRMTSQADDCSKNSDCPLFTYNVTVPEMSSALSQWFEMYSVNDGNGSSDVNVDINIQGSDVDSDIFIHEAVNGSDQSNLPLMIFDAMPGFSENTAQILEMHAESPGVATYYLDGGEVFETYSASLSAPIKTRTVSFPLGVLTNGQSLSTASATASVYFPENGSGYGIVDIKKAWFRVVSNSYDGAARTITVSSKVGDNSKSSNYVYSLDTGTSVVKPSFNIIHVIPSSNYSELELANANSAKNVSVYATNDSNNIGGVSAELMITYTYTGETSGYLSSINLFGGQSNVSANSHNFSSESLRAVFPELRGDKTLRSASLLSSYLINDSDNDVPSAWFSLGSNISASSPSCSNSFYSHTDSVNSFTEYYFNIRGAMTSIDNQVYQTCISNYNPTDDSAGAKMNSIWLYTYQWDAPPSDFTQYSYRWYENNDAISPVTAMANEGESISNVNLADVLRLRMNIAISGSLLATNTQTFKLQYGTSTDCTTISDWYDVGGLAADSDWRAYNNPSPIDGTTLDSYLLATSTVSESYEEVNPSVSNPKSIAIGGYGEWDWVIVNNSASSDVGYCFRMVEGDSSSLDTYLNSSYAKLTTAPSNTLPNNPVSLGQFSGDGTSRIINSSWHASDTIQLTASVIDPNINETLSLYFEFIDNNSTPSSGASEPVGACSSGTAYESCASKIWYVSSGLGTFIDTPFIATTTITGIISSSTGYKWQVMACDDDSECTSWVTYGSQPNLYIDTVAPTPPGSLVFASSSPTAISLTFGSETVEDNFDTYRIFYKVGTSGVDETDDEHTDLNLGYIDYNGYGTTTLTNLSANTTYVFNIWAYDEAGNKASATVETLGTTASSYNPPTGFLVATNQKDDGTGAIDIAILVDDPDNDNTLRARILFDEGIDCDFSTPAKATLDETDENISATYGDPDIDNNSFYQVGTSTSWIISSLGQNYVFFDWLSKYNAPNANTTYCLGLVVNDGLFDQVATHTKLVLIDNLAPSTPGALTINKKNFDSVVLNFGAESFDSRFDQYKIYYHTGTTTVSEDDTVFDLSDDPNLDNVDYGEAATTTISGLEPNTWYSINIWAYDNLGNKASSTQLNFKTNASPTNISADNQYRDDGITLIPNNTWINENNVILRSSVHDQDSGDLVTFYYELIPVESNFSSSNQVPVNVCSSGTSYGVCSSHIWEVSTTTYSLPADWYDADWLYRKILTIDSGLVLADQNDYPLLATTTDSDLAAYARSDGLDILFTDSSGTTTLMFELENFDSSSGELVAWIKTNISSLSDTVVYMYYGNSSWSTDLSTSTGVWMNNFSGVWHLDENVIDDSSQVDIHFDYSGNSNYGSQYGNNELGAWIYNGQSFDGIDDYISVADSASLDFTSSMSMSFWMNASVAENSSTTIFSVVGSDNFVVPDGVTQITVKSWGAGGGGGSGGSNGASQGGIGGGGAYGEAIFNVSPGETLNVHVGGAGGGGTYDGSTAGGGGGGGGRTEVVRASDSNTLIVVAAGGGGGGGYDTASDGGAGGAGGAISGSDGSDSGSAGGGGGATLSAGGTGGTGGNNTGSDGASITGGAGADGRNGEGADGSENNGGVTNGGDGGGATVQGPGNAGGGGGGSGYYGGGGGSSAGATGAGAGGGGGSTYVSLLAISSSTESGSGNIAANTDDSDYVSGIGSGGTGGNSTLAGSSGGDGYLLIKYNVPVDIIKKGSDAYRIKLDSDKNLSAYINNQVATATIDNGWNYIVLTYDQAAGGTEEMKIFINGTKVGTADYSTLITANNDPLIIGENLNGLIDQFEISSTARTENWVKTRYNNLSAANDFVNITSSDAVTSYYESSLIVSIPDNPSNGQGYKWQVMACDDDSDCSAWDAFNIVTPNFKIDTTAPSPPGQLLEYSQTSNTITLQYGLASTEDNFKEYKIFYNTSGASVSESDIEISSSTDNNLYYQDYNSANTITVYGLDPVTTYYFNIWAYDVVDNKASSTQSTASTNAAVSTPGAMFYTKNDSAIYYRVWTGSSWGTEQSSGNITAAGDNIRHIKALRSNDGGKVGIVFKTWDGTNQEWWGTVYRFAANDFVDSTQLDTSYASTDNNQLLTACIAYLSDGEFVVIKNNNGTSGTRVHSWNPIDAWTSEGAGPDPGAVMNGCELEHRPGTDNYLLLTFDEDSDVGSSYYIGGSSYVDNWTNWTQHSSQEEDLDNYVGQAFFDTSNNTRGAISFSNSNSNSYTYAKYFICDSSSINYGGQVSSPSTAPNDWGSNFVHGVFAADPGQVGIAYFAGRDTGGELNVYKVDVTNPTISWSTLTNGDNISKSLLYSETNDSQKPFSIEFYESSKGVVTWADTNNTQPVYLKLTASTDTLDASTSTVPGSDANNWTRTKFYKDPNIDEMLTLYQNDDVDFSAVFWDGGNDQFYSSGNQAWLELASNNTVQDADDRNASYAFAKYNSSPNPPYSLEQYKTDASTTISNGEWTNEDTVNLVASTIDYDTSEEVSLYVQLIANIDTFATTTDGLSSSCDITEDFSACSSKIWFIASSSGDFSYESFTATATISGISNSSIGYKWQTIACDDESACSVWVKYNISGPNFKVDTTPPTPPGNLSVSNVSSESLYLVFGGQSTEDNFDTYKIFYKEGTSGVTEFDTEHIDVNLGSQNYATAIDTQVSGLSSSTQYVFNIWAYDLAGNKASATVEIATTTHNPAYLDQVSFLLENDDGATVNDNSTEASPDTALSDVYIGERINARIQLENTGGDSAIDKVYKLQFENQTDSPGVWTDVGAATEISYSGALSGDSGDTITGFKASANTHTWQDGAFYQGVYQTTTYSLPKNYYTEFVFAIETSNSLTGKTYRLRLYNETDNRFFDEYTIYPSISTISSDIIRYSKESTLSLASSEDDLSYYFDPEGYADINSDDDTNRDELIVDSGYGAYVFATKHVNNTDAASTTWNGQSSTSTVSKNIFLQVYRFGSTNDWVTLDTEFSVLANTDFDLYGEVNSNLSEYYDASNWIYWRVYKDTGSYTLRSDYIDINFSAPIPYTEQIHFRWREDDGTETTATWRELEDIGNPTAGNALGRGSSTRMRIEIANTGGGDATNYNYRLEYATSSDACVADFGAWTALPNTATTEHFEMATSSYFADWDPTTAQLNNSETYSFTAGDMVEETSNSSDDITLSEGFYTEIEYMFYVTNSAIAAETYCFRVTDSGTLLNEYSLYPALTITGSNNSAPYFNVYPSDGGSASTSPTNEDSQITFTATAQDDDGNDYYLAVCQTNSISPGNNTAPTCNGGSWCISDSTTPSTEASCSYTANAATEENPWYAFACDKLPGFGVSQCSPMSQGEGNIYNDSPFVINHRPSFTSVSTLINNQDPGSRFTISTVSSDTDTFYATNTLYLYVCYTDSANFAGCTGGVDDTVCSAIATSSPNAKCDYDDVAPTPAGANTYYAYLFDNHGLAASNNSLSSSYSINNVSPVFGSLVLNGGTNIQPNIRGMSDKVVSVSNGSVQDFNGCTDITSAVSSVYISNAVGSHSCSPDDNTCYQITTDNCSINDCIDASDSTASVICTTTVRYFINPTDSFSNNPSLYWEGYMQLSDGTNFPATTSNQVDVETNIALDVFEDLIDFGSEMFAGENTENYNATTTIVNAGNSPIDTNLSGTDMDSPGYTITVNNIEWNTSVFTYNSGTDLTIGGVNVDIIAPKPTSIATTSDEIYWGMEIPFGADATTYNGYNTFTVILDGDGW